MRDGSHAPWWSWTYARAYVVTMRPYLLFVSGAAALVGLSFAPGLPGVRALVAFFPLFLSYGFGQALTDCFQTDTDSISAPYRPLVRGVITKSQVLVTSLVCLVAVVLVLAALNPWMLLFGGLAVVGLATYTPLKRTWWGGPPWNSWIVALLPVMGRLAARGSAPTDLFASATGPPTFAFAVGAVFFAYMNFVVMGYFKDISADRASGYNTFPVVFGWRAAAVYGDLTAVAASLLAAAVVLTRNPWPPALVVLFVGIVLQASAQVRMHRTRDEALTGRAIADGVRALVLFAMAMTLANRPDWWPWLPPFYVFFELTLRVRPAEGQV
jgi:4-hydroxybenzoate polyprenyltransferase